MTIRHLVQAAKSIQIDQHAIDAGLISSKIQFSIRCLEASLLLQPNPQVLDILYDLAYMYMTYSNNNQKAESLIQRALLIASKSCNQQYLYKLTHLQIIFYITTCKYPLAKKCIASTILNTKNDPEWLLKFQLLKLELLRNNNEWESYLHSTNQVIMDLNLSKNYYVIVLLFNSRFSYY